MNSRSDAERGATVSPTTGKTAIDFMRAAVTACGSAGTLAKRIGRAAGLVYKWLAGANEPSYGALIEAEQASGVSLDEYMPEIRRGAQLFRCAEEWREGLLPPALINRPPFVGEEKLRKILKGNYREDTLTVRNLVGVCEYRKWWDEEGSHQPKEARNDDLQSCASPATGKTFAEYIHDRMRERGMNGAEFARLTGICASTILRYANGTREPRILALRGIEEACGVSIAGYIPEINRGMEIFRNWESWKEGFTLAKLHRNGVCIGEERYESIIAGVVDEGYMTIHNTVAVCEYYDRWMEEHAGECAETPEETAFSKEADYIREARAEEESGEKGYYAAMRIARKIVQNCKGSEIKLRRIRRDMWTFETKRVYRCEIDFEHNEFRAYRKRDGGLSVRRKLSEFA